jgi:hypothetical protein
MSECIPRRINISDQKIQDVDFHNEKGPIYLECDIYQAAILNLLLPKGFKIEQDE